MIRSAERSDALLIASYRRHILYFWRLQNGHRDQHLRLDILAYQALTSEGATVAFLGAGQELKSRGTLTVSI